MSTYSKKAMPQLARMTTASGALLYFKCPYQATVMKMFEQASRTMGSQRELRRSFMGVRFLKPHRNVLFRQEALHVPDGKFAEMKYARRQHRVGPPLDQHVCHVPQRARTPACHDRHAHRLADATRDHQVEAGLGAVRVDAVEHDLARAERDGALRPLHGIETSGLAAAVRKDLPAVRRHFPGIVVSIDARKMAPARINSGVARAEELTLILSAPALSMACMSST